MSGAVYKLIDNQLRAANPDDNVWLSASAGTGKTQVLSARVLRLLLTPGVEPSQILCLTFTKAGAAEMANRINSVLARWVRLSPGKLAIELGDLGADIGPDTLAKARTLFASVLDCPGGGLRIDTIHAFAQWLLGNFPEEAGLIPGARPIEDRERELLAREVLTDLLARAHETGDTAITQAAARFARDKNPEAVRHWVMRCAASSDLWEGPGGWQPPMRDQVHTLLGLPVGADAAWAAEVLHPDLFPDDHLRAMLPLMQGWRTQVGGKCAEFIPQWLACPADRRSNMVDRFLDTVLTKKGDPREMKVPAKADPTVPERQQEIAQSIALYRERHTMLALADVLVPALELGRAFALKWNAAKLREGLLDFDDLIRKAARLLGDNDAAAWIRYKLDRAFDHVLIDEAQDTNEAQWDIVFALIDDFFTGEGARGDRLRTIFTVGDYKQAIFAFQGTSPDNFERAKEKVLKRIDALREHVQKDRSNRRLPGWAELDLGQSFRTSMPLLDFVNRAIETIGHAQFGLKRSVSPHEGEDRAGLVTLWEPVTSAAAADAEQFEGERDWLPAHDTLLAERIAEQVRRWVSGDEPFVLEKGPRRHARAGDIMVLVRKRKELAAQIVGKLHAKGVRVAGVDRMRLGAPLAVKDLMAALRFAAQPGDDLSLANLLVSPLIGWTQEELLEHVPRPAKVRLWDHLRAIEDEPVAASVDALRDLLARADYRTPQALLAWLLTGDWKGRERLTARLGAEANDPIDELLNAAFAYESAGAPSLAGFIEWFDAGTGELKRDPDEAADRVRVMTVHGAKGLQAPIVILADATGEPGAGGAIELTYDPLHTGDGKRRVPLPDFRQDQQVGAVKAARDMADAAAMEEHWRLLYVAITRAEEALFIGGSLGPRHAEKGPPEDSWYARLEPLFDTPSLTDDIWHERRELGTRADPVVAAEMFQAEPMLAKLPDWARNPIGSEPRPPRPLAPSSTAHDRSADPPYAPEDAAIAARRGTLIHRLLERLPDLAPDERGGAARAWLERQAGDLAPDIRAEMIERSLDVLDDPRFADVFSPGALAEVPVAARVDDIVITGTVDRLLVTDNSVTAVDFKTTSRPPAGLVDVPPSALRQMAAYTAVLETIYPGRAVRAAILYTQTPVLFALPPEVLEPHKPRLGKAEQTYAPVRIE